MLKFIYGFLIFFIASCSSNAEELMLQPKPSHIVEFTCQQFREKATKCENYTCETPSNLDPSVKTVWEIKSFKDNRCTISYTTLDIGLRDNEKNPVPITQTCDYDNDGTETLMTFLDDIQSGYFHHFTAENQEGVYNCQLSSQGNSISSALKGQRSTDE